MHARHGNAAEAESAWRRAAAADPRDLASRRQLAAFYDQAGRLEASLAVVEELVGMAPGDPAYWLTAGVLNARLNRFNAAERSFGRAIDVAPDRPEGHLALTQLYLRSGQKTDAARQAATKAVELAPTAANYAVLSAAAERAGDLPAARTAIDRAVALEPGNYTYLKRRIELQEPE